MSINKLLSFLYLSIFLFCSAESYAQTSLSPKQVISDVHRIVAPKGIQETYKAKIGALDQWVYVRGRNKDNPIILFLHGGPASPSSPSMWMYQRPIEEFLTVVNYDPRGSGRTYLENKPYEASESLTIDQYVSDAIELTEYICKRYGVNKVVLAGWIGLDTAIITIFHIK